MKFKKILLKISIFFICITTIFYILFLTVLPAFLSSQLFFNSVKEVIFNKTGIIINSKKFDIKTSPLLIVSFSAEKLTVTSNENELLKAKNTLVTFDIKKLKAKNIDIEYVYINQKNFQNLINTQKNKKTSDFKLISLPDINIKKADIWSKKDEINSIFVSINNLYIKNENNKITCNFNAEIISNFLKNVIHIGQNGCIYLKNNELYADNLELLTGVSKLILNGKIIDNKKKSHFTIKGQNLPISDITSSLLYFQKVKDNSKKFMENFYDYSGNINVDLLVRENGIFGYCNAVNLSGKTVLFNVPIKFKYVPFKFNGNIFSAKAEGFLGQEKVYTDFILSNMFSNNRETIGSIHSILTNKSVSKYIPNTTIKGSADIWVKYHIKNQKINVFYNLDLPVNSDIKYLDAHLGFSEKNRKMFVETLKKDDKLEIKKYEYSINDNGINTKIITGNGLFIKKYGNFRPDYITCKTENDAPVSIAASFYKYLKGGLFNGNLKYDFNKNKVTGIFNIKNSRYKHYIIDTATINANNDTVNITTKGKYINSPFSASIYGLNDFNNKIKIYNLSLFLEEFTVNTHQRKSNVKINEKMIKQKADNFDIDLYNLKLNKIKYKKAILKDILVKGSIKNDVFNFNVPHISFANGILQAKGVYDFNNRTSDVVISAKNINSDIFAYGFFNLENQIKGIADAKIEIKTKNGIKDKLSHFDFTIKEGYLPQLGNIKIQTKLFHKKKVVLKDIINIDMKNIKSYASNLNGAFDIDNGQIQNAKINSYNDYLSLLIIGDYNIDTQLTNLEIFGKYDKDEFSKIKILYVPLSVIIKMMFRTEKTMNKYEKILNEIPDISESKDTKAFRILINGNIKSKNLKIEKKSIL